MSRDAQLRQEADGEDARLHVLADRHDRPLEVGHAELPQGVLVGRVRLDRMREPVRVPLNERTVGVDRHDFDAKAGQRHGERAAESAQADHEDRAGPGVLSHC